MRFGLLGYPLGHSFSAAYFKKKFSAPEYAGWSYSNFERQDLDAFFKDEAKTLDGFNVTIPYKQAVIPYLDSLSKEAEEIGAVNCISNVEGRLIGHNTDVYGFRISLEKLLDGSSPEYALVLGSGGASKAVGYVLKKKEIPFDVVSRTGVLNYGNLDAAMKRAGLIVNATPLGMYPKTEGKPALDYRLLSDGCRLYDLVYNPEVTAFLKEGIERGLKVSNGREMLNLQADKSFEIWTSYI